MISRKSEFEIERMRRAGAYVALILNQIVKAIEPGIATKDLDHLAEKKVKEYEVIPAFKDYQGFPAALCVSINEEVVHGIPSSRRLEEGDIVGLDFGVVYEGYYGDAAVTVGVGSILPEHEKLLRVTRESLWKGIEQARAGRHLSAVSAAIQKHVEGAGFSVVREFVGHGIGQSMHEEPQIPNFISSLGRSYDPVLKPGMTLAIEPMVNAGGYEVMVSKKDLWTVTTKDRSYSAHFEHTVLVTEGEPEILTKIQRSDDTEEVVSW